MAAEHVDAGRRGACDEEAHDVVGIVGIAHPVRPAQQHLQQQVRDPRAQRREPFPRILAQEAQRHVEGRPAPALDREQLRQETRVVRRDCHHVEGAQPRRKERLVCIPQSGVSEEHALLGKHPARECIRTELGELLARAGRRRLQRLGRQPCRRGDGRPRASLDGGVAVDDGRGQAGQHARRAVAFGRRAKQLRRLLDEARGVLAPGEARMRDE
jgi:hypothetical protein